MSSSNVSSKSYGVDVASYQSTTVSYSGAKFAFVKISEGTDYVNPRASAQIKSAKAHDLMVMGYFYANHSASVTRARAEAKYCVAKAKALGIPAGSYLADDFEQGLANSVYGGPTANTDAILAAMQVIKEAGYKPLVYASASVFRANLQVSRFVKSYGTCLWVASYKVSGRQDYADFGYFPSMDGVAIWQFTDDWKGMSVDGNISLIDLKSDSKPTPQPSNSSSAKTTSTERTWTDVQGMTWHAEDGTFITGGAINLRWGASTESMLITTLPAGSVVKYNAWARDSAGRVWLQQPRGSNHYGYLVGRVGNEPWGTFK